MVTSLENDEKTVKLPSGQHRAELKEEALKLWDSDIPMYQIDRLLKVRCGTTKAVFEEAYGSEALKQRKRRLYQLSKLGANNPMLGNTGIKHPNYKGRASDNKGYYTVTRPHWMQGKSVRAFEHHVIWLAFHKLTKLPLGCCIHHIDLNPSNNAISNLVLMTTSEHTALHATFRRCNDYGISQYTQASGSTSALLQREREIVCSWRQRQAG